MDRKGPLPPGYEARWDHGQKAYFFINHADKSTTWIDPRTTQTQAPARPRTPQKITTQRNHALDLLNKLKQMFPDCPEEIIQSVTRSCGDNFQAAEHQLKLLGFRENASGGESVSPSHSAVRGRTSQPKQQRTTPRKSNESIERPINTLPSRHITEPSPSHRITEPSHRITDSGHRITDTGSSHQITDTGSSHQITDIDSGLRKTVTGTTPRITDTGSANRTTDTGSGHRITDTGSANRTTDTDSGHGITDTSSANRITDTGSGHRITGTRRGVDNSKSQIKAESKPSVNPISAAIGRNVSLQSGPDPTLRLSQHMTAYGHDTSLTEGADASRRVGSTGWVGADRTLYSGCAKNNRRVVVTNI